MNKQQRGESSSKNELSDGEKPLKKARYVWEVKGKHHLKEKLSNNNNNNSIETPEPNKTEKARDKCSCLNNKIKHTSTSSSSSSGSSTTTNKCCLESFLAKTEAIMDSDCEDEPRSSKLPLENMIENEIPITLVSAQPQNDDYILHKWQARQIARGFVDNTINSVLETWNNPPFEASDFVENCENDGQVEDDAILMAIQSHGLQSRSSFSNFCRDNSTEQAVENFAIDNIKEYHREQEIEPLHTMSIDSSSIANSSTAIRDEDPMDFLNAAVSVAIEKKGLSYS